MRTKVNGASLFELSAPPKELCAALSVPASMAATRAASACISELRGGRSVEADEEEYVPESRSSPSSKVVRPTVTANALIASVASYRQ